MSSSIPRPSVPPNYPPFPTRRFRDLPTVLPSFNSYPVLPSPPRPLDFVPGYNVTTHIIPASYPRHSFLEPRRYPQLKPVPFIPPPPEAKRERQAWATDTATKLRGKRATLLQLRTENRDSEVLNDPPQSPVPVLWNVVNRYARIGAPKEKRGIGITVVIAHANGFHKETWEPTIKHLISLCGRRSSGIHIDEIWAIDAANHGDSALLNEKHFGDVFDWIDNAQDVLNFVENFIPEGPFVAPRDPLPVHLERVSSGCSSRRHESGFHDRNVVGLGHSLGGCAIAGTACANPNIFHSITLVDPIILPESTYRAEQNVIAALLRRQSWSSREEAKALFLRNPFFNVWVPEVLDLYVQYALTDISPSEGGGVRLKMNGFQEAVCFADEQAARETYQLLGGLDEKVKIKWIMARSSSNERVVELTQAMVWRRPVNSANVQVNSGHLIVQEAPLELAKEAVYSWQVMYAEKADPVWARI
ncbi:hypothetical protein BS47DRAFT_1314716 [Hydnum rufescens UP504]|uniref:AB hydrolase-1 domain-containing protein n=1 Tax=Hydnum rufescens UP504 TaxID=1448309 RepID=A0A9P6B495_9AGAM|nr:hypothetical protein BS47DRAFT_1314716 [Hydnum rufescens UP504]